MPAITPVLVERAALETREHQAAARADGVLEHAEDAHVEALDRGALEDGAPDALHAGPHVAQRQDVHGRGRPLRERRGGSERAAQEEAQPASDHPLMLGARARARNAARLTARSGRR